MRFELLSIDMFQTLVNVDTRIPHIWKRILNDNYNESLALECANSVNKNVFYGFQKFSSSNIEFINIKTMFEPFFQTVFHEMNILFDAKEAVQIFLDEHTKATPYNDVEIFFKLLKNKIPICLISDADYDMVSTLIKKYPFDQVFISEEIRSYKNDPGSKIFKEVINNYSVKPSKILHIGDSASDIIGANRVGIKTCWINRANVEWNHDIKPDYIIKSLEEVLEIIDF